MSTTQEQLFSTLAGILPALQGRLAPAAAAQSDLPARLLAHWRTAQPQAGRIYWAARSWSMLIWQPAYLSVLAVHCGQAALPLAGLQQDVHGGGTAGFALPASQPASGETARLIAAAAAALLAYQDEQLPLLQSAQPYSAYQASCLTVDCVLSALQLASSTLGWDSRTELAWMEVWLAALRLPRHGRLMAVELPDGQCRTALDRKGCCQHFRIPGAEACSSCPRWPAAERLQRIRQELQASD
ncbi:siderophore ferric iron reductase [Chitinilyticum litopenaei]|uniref:siderophore ferric iron reductase n=1 Tax=Chitinilyticum litopenaei TaxID=1121276 RepID=UPI0004075ADF|nr:siderophore ferric iron reductase [Chitinilyticum litopenaei]